VWRRRPAVEKQGRRRSWESSPSVLRAEPLMSSRPGYGSGPVGVAARRDLVEQRHDRCFSSVKFVCGADCLIG
jgi:hypothetical protein